MHHATNLLTLICIYLVALRKTSFQSTDTESVKKELTLEANFAPYRNAKQPKLLIPSENVTSVLNFKGNVIQMNPYKVDIPESFRYGFYLFIGLSVVGTFFIVVKIYRMRLSRAERKYGVHGDRSTQELTPLPMGIEDDSENGDHTVFDINRQIRVS